MYQSDFHVQGPQIHQFNNIAPKPIPRSAFKRDYPRRMTFDQDYLVPLFVDEILPGDDVNLKLHAIVRQTTPIKPIMDNLYLDTFFFFVPYRIVWNNFQKFQGEVEPNDSTVYTIPVLDVDSAPLNTTGFAVGSVQDYMNIPPLVTGIDNISALYLRGYQLIWNEWFRDENIQASIGVQKGDGPDSASFVTLLKRNKRKDYFTSGLPWPQKGTAVTISLGSSAPISSLASISATSTGVQPQLSTSGAGTNWTNQALITYAGGAAGLGGSAALTNTPKPTFFGSVTGLEITKASLEANLTADLSSATAVTINAVRQAALYQQILELDARAGTRYVESIFSRFGVVSPDFRLQRPELIGQGSTRLNTYPVPQTSATGGTGTPQGNLSAFATGTIAGDHGCRYSATEHGMIIGLVNVRADLTYSQGLPRMYSRRTRLDFYEPLLNGLGEQSVPSKEIYCDGTAGDDDVFIYQERFAEYRFRNAELCGLFRPQVPSDLAIWHVGQEFGARPVLNSSFIELNTPMDRISAVTTEPKFYFDGHFDYTHVRPMPIRSNPGISKL